MFELLEECRNIQKEIKSIEERVEEITLSVSAPKNQSFDNMPKPSSRTGSPIEAYIEKKEELLIEKSALCKELSNKWKEASKALKLSDFEVEEKLLLYHRFHEGKSWRKCGMELGWNDNKVFRVYSKIKKHIENTLK